MIQKLWDWLFPKVDVKDFPKFCCDCGNYLEERVDILGYNVYSGNPTGYRRSLICSSSKQVKYYGHCNTLEEPIRLYKYTEDEGYE